MYKFIRLYSCILVIIIKIFSMKTLYNVVFLLVCVSCQNGKESPSRSIEQNKDLQTININCETIKYKRVDEVFDSVSYVKLSNEKEAFIGRVEQIIIADSLIIIRDEYMEKLVKMFDKNGNFLCRIGNVGRGPGEYIKPSYMQLYGEKIAVYDEFSKQILFYNMQGRHLYSHSFKELFFMKFHIFDNNHYLFNSINSDNSEDIEDYSLFECDSLGTVLNKSFYREQDSYISLKSPSNFFAQDSTLYYVPVYADTLFSYHPLGKIKPLFAFDFGDKGVPESVRAMSNSNNYQKELDSKGYIKLGGNFSILDSLVSFQFIENRSVRDCIYDTVENALYQITLLDCYYPLIYLNILTTTDNALVGYISPYILADDIKNGRKAWNEETEEKLLKNLNPNDNIVVTFFYPKR